MEEYKKELEALLDKGASKLEAAYTIIRKMIMDNCFQPGKALSERLLSGTLGISRTPIRAALNRLYYEGYVDMRGDVCTIVADLSIQDILEIFEIREGLECKAAELFVLRHADVGPLGDCMEKHRQAVENGNKEQAREKDNELHLLIARGSGNRRLFTLLSTYVDLSHKSFALESSYEYRYEKTLVQHEDIVGALASGDTRMATDSIRTHFMDVRDYFKSRFFYDEK